MSNEEKESKFGRVPDSVVEQIRIFAQEGHIELVKFKDGSTLSASHLITGIPDDVHIPGKETLTEVWRGQGGTRGLAEPGSPSKSPPERTPPAPPSESWGGQGNRRGI